MLNMNQQYYTDGCDSDISLDTRDANRYLRTGKEYWSEEGDRMIRGETYCELWSKSLSFRELFFYVVTRRMCYLVE